MPHSSRHPVHRLLAALSLVGLAACQYMTPLPDLPRTGHAATTAPEPEPPLPLDALRPSPRRLVGRILSIDEANHFAFVALATEPPAAALADGAELTVRGDDLRETGRIRTSRYAHARTLGTQIIQGQPSPGDEVVFQAP